MILSIELDREPYTWKLISLLSMLKEQPSSDSFYDSDNDAGSDLTTVERPGRGSAAGQHSLHHEDEDSGADERQRHDSAEVDGWYSIPLYFMLV